MLSDNAGLHMLSWSHGPHSTGSGYSIVPPWVARHWMHCQLPQWDVPPHNSSLERAEGQMGWLGSAPCREFSAAPELSVLVSGLGLLGHEIQVRSRHLELCSKSCSQFQYQNILDSHLPSFSNFLSQLCDRSLLSRIKEAEAGWSYKWVWGQFGLHSKILSQNSLIPAFSIFFILEFVNRQNWKGSLQ